MPETSPYSPPEPERSPIPKSGLKGFTALFIGTHDAPMQYPPVVSARDAISNVLKGRVEVVSEREVTLSNGDVAMVPEIVRSKHLFEGLHNRLTGKPAAFNLKNLAVRDGFICQYTGVTLNIKDPDPDFRATFDHIVPVAQGGTRGWLNAAAASETINIRKADRTPEEAGLVLLNDPWEPTLQDMLYLQIRYWMTRVTMPDAWKCYVENVRPTPRVQRMLDSRDLDVSFYAA